MCHVTAPIAAPCMEDLVSLVRKVAHLPELSRRLECLLYFGVRSVSVRIGLGLAVVLG